MKEERLVRKAAAAGIQVRGNDIWTRKGAEGHEKCWTPLFFLSVVN